MSLKTALYSAKANGAATMGIVNPECWQDGDEEWDVEPTPDIKTILEWMGQTDDLPVIVFFNKYGIVLGQWVILWENDGEDWLSDCDTGTWTEGVTSGHY